MTDDLDTTIARYVDQELTFEEAVEQADVDEQAFASVLTERDIEIRPWPISKDTDEIIAYLAREMVVPISTPDGYVDAYGLSRKGQDLVYARPPCTGHAEPPPAIEILEKLGISSDAECEKVRKQIENHPEWGDNITLELPDHVTEESQ